MSVIVCYARTDLLSRSPESVYFPGLLQSPKSCRQEIGTKVTYSTSYDSFVHVRIRLGVIRLTSVDRPTTKGRGYAVLFLGGSSEAETCQTIVFVTGGRRFPGRKIVDGQRL
jgi:hypothetical protein